MNVRTCAAVGALLIAVLSPASAGALNPTSYVSGVGDDTNPCSRTAPCKTFAGAIPQTDEFGTINPIDLGNYGFFSLDKSLTIDGGEETATISTATIAAAADGITIDGNGKDVILRRLRISGTSRIGATLTKCAYLTGINIVAARTVRIEDVTLEHFATAAITITPSAGATTVYLKNIDVSDGCGTGKGVVVAPTGGATAAVLLDRVRASGLVSGVSVGDGGHAWLKNSTIFGNTTGIEKTGTGIIDSVGGNSIVGNGTDGVPSSESGGNGGPAGPGGAQGPAGPGGLVGPQGAAGANGAAGVDGAAGAQGPVGPTGATGPAGAMGATGAGGAAGAVGDRGPRGPAGADAPDFTVRCKLRQNDKITCTVQRKRAAVLSARRLANRTFRVRLRVGHRVVTRRVRVQ
jgi:hypothetical protein